IGNIPDRPFFAVGLEQLAKILGVLGAAAIALGAALCCVAPDKAIARMARLCNFSFLALIVLESISILLRVFSDRLPRHDGIAVVGALCTMLGVIAGIVAIVAWFLMHAAIGRRGNAVAMNRGIGLYIAAVIGGLWLMAWSNPDDLLRRFGVQDVWNWRNV